MYTAWPVSLFGRERDARQNRLENTQQLMKIEKARENDRLPNMHLVQKTKDDVHTHAWKLSKKRLAASKALFFKCIVSPICQSVSGVVRVSWDAMTGHCCLGAKIKSKEQKFV